MHVLTPPVAAADVVSRVHRVSLPSGVDDRLYFGQVREDPLLEIEALEPGPEDSIVIVGSGGCTALSLLAAGAGHVTAVDVNRAQNHLIELKVAALAVLSRAETLAFLGATPGSGAFRLRAYDELRAHLTPPALAYWDGHRSGIAAGVLNAGVTEHFIRMVVRVLRLAVHSRGRIEALEIPHFALAEHEDAGRLQIFVEPGERKPGLLNVWAGDDPLESGIAAEQFDRKTHRVGPTLEQA